MWAPPGLGPLGKRHRQYLRRRGYNPDRLLRDWELIGTEHLSGPAWSWRIIFPILNREGRVVAYGGRSLSDKTKPKYRLPEDSQITVNPKSLLYGIHHVEGDAVVVVEGPADVRRLGKGSVATLGTGWNVEQAVQLKRFQRRYIMMDPDSSGQEQGEKLANWLGMYSGETEIIEGLFCDPGDLDQKEADQIMKELVE